MATPSCAQGTLLLLELQSLTFHAMLWSTHDYKEGRTHETALQTCDHTSFCSPLEVAVYEVP